MAAVENPQMKGPSPVNSLVHNVKAIRSQLMGIEFNRLPLFTSVIVVFCFAFAELQAAPKQKKHSWAIGLEGQKWSEKAAAGMMPGADTFDIAGVQ